MQYLRTTEAADRLGVSKSFLEKRRCHGDGPTYLQLGGKLVVYREADLDAWAAQRARHSTSALSHGAAA